MNIILTSEHRVGSRWIHYLLADLLDKSVSPEMEGRQIDVAEVRQRFADNKIVKFHHGTPLNIFVQLGELDYKVIGIVRNPRDRAVSFAFHNKYHNLQHGYTLPFKNLSDEEAVRKVVLDFPMYKKGNRRQLELMLPGESTKNYENGNGYYIWTTYKWLKEDTAGEISRLVNYLDLKPRHSVRAIVAKNSFKAKSGRDQGSEKRDDVWRRKGVTGDWINWFTPELIAATEEAQKNYVEIVTEEELNGIS